MRFWLRVNCLCCCCCCCCYIFFYFGCFANDHASTGNPEQRPENAQIIIITFVHIIQLNFISRIAIHPYMRVRCIYGECWMLRRRRRKKINFRPPLLFNGIVYFACVQMRWPFLDICYRLCLFCLCHSVISATYSFAKRKIIMCAIGFGMCLCGVYTCPFPTKETINNQR